MVNYLIGTVVGLFLGIATVVTGDNYTAMKNAKEQCEKSLPRDQQCTIIAVPVSKD